ncbi:MAG: LuxR C-terminal-related transcriptional regulator [Thermoanaerobaculales bacterium]
MASSLLETKLNVPRLRHGLVVRPRLVESLVRGAESKLTLISAPAGSGKTTLLADWVTADPPGQGSPGWLSLDPADNQYPTFWTYLIAALQTVAPGVGVSALPLLREPQPPPPEATLTTLINELSAAPNDVRLVLDDYHLIDAPEIQDGMAFFLEHLPKHIHLVIATRADPALPLARLRAQGELVEIRAADLRFTPDEADAYLNEMMGLALTTHEVAVLEERTEGWIVALQLAALSMQGRKDVSDFIAGFAGSERYIVDYLVEEVLQRQPEQVRRFLLQTSILDRLTGPLCDAVTGHEGAKAMLEALDRGNLFIVPLDDHRRWYRYHHLFADVLQARLLDEQPDRVLDLHRRASDWYERNGDRSEAIQHAIAGEDFERAADLVELAIPALRQARQETTLRRWLEALPDDLLQVRPVLSVGYAGTLLVSGELEGVETLLRDAERWLDEPAEDLKESEATMIVANNEEFRRLPSAIALYRAGQARILGDEAGTIAHASRAFDLAGDDDHLVRGGAAGLMALAHWTRGDLDAAYRFWADAMASLEKAGHLSDVIGCAIALADIRITQGRLGEARGIYERGLDLATDPAGFVRRGAADMHVGMSEILRERDDLAGAREHLLKARELGDENGLTQNRYRSRVAAARIRQTEGDLDDALELLAEAERVYVSDFYPNVHPVPALKAKLLVTAGRLSDAFGWAREIDLSISDDLSYLREFEHITLTRVLLTQAKDGQGEYVRSDVLKFVGRLLEAAENGGRTASVIEILIIQALAYHAGDDTAAALESLEKAIVLAEPERYVRIVVDEGALIEPLLRLAAKQGKAPGHARRLLTAFGGVGKRAPIEQGLIEPLTERELQVLRLLSSDLAGPDIARELFVSLNTMRTHTRSIYTKLGVNSRRAAVRRAAELDLLPRSHIAR